MSEVGEPGDLGMSGYSFGYRPEPPDTRDLLVTMPKYDLPKKIDWTEQVTGVKDQGQEGCHDEKTEILTDEGWKQFADLNRHEKVATINPQTQNLEFQEPKRYFEYDYEGEIYHLSGQRMDCKITPSHNLWVRKWDQRKKKLSDSFQIIRAKELGWYVGLLSKVHWEGKSQSVFHLKSVEFKSCKINRKNRWCPSIDIPMDNWIKFLGIYLAEGCVTFQRRGNYRIEIAAKDLEKRKKIERILQKLPFKFTPYEDRFTCWDKRLYQEFLPLGQALGKFIPQYAKELSSRQIKLFLESFLIGDGHQTKDGRRWFYTSSKQLADDLLELIFKMGKWGSIVTRQPRMSMIQGRKIKSTNPGYVVAVYRTSHFSIERRDQLYSEFYKGKTYCVEVPNHLLLTRRNGKPIVTGNSCVGQAVTGLKEWQEWKEHGKKFDLSERWIYEMAKDHDEWPGSSYEGTSIRGAMKALAQHGICEEKHWPYVAGKRGEPDDLASEDAYQYRIEKYRSLTIPQKDIKLVKRGLHETGPIALAFAVHGTWFDIGKDGIIKKPGPKDKILGYHAVLGIAYDEKYLKVKNSWGKEWGAEGFGYLALDYALDILHSAWAAYDIYEGGK